MNIEFVKRQVEFIDGLCNEGGEDQQAHCLEDALHLAFINHVAATGTPDLVEMATEILKVREMKFSRWYG